MKYSELDGNQRRHLINVKEAFHTWREALKALHRAGGMHWKNTSGGKTYLYNTKGRVEKSLGLESPETQRIFEDHAQQVIKIKERLDMSSGILERSARLSKALFLGRLPTIAARILRKLDDVGLLDNALLVVGTNALFAYESGTGIVFDSAIVATDDLDLLWDSRQRMSLLLPEMDSAGVFGLLQQVDKTFQRSKPYQAKNDESYLVDLIRPEQVNEMFKKAPRLSAAKDDFEPAAIEGLSWLVNAPRYEEIVIAEDGLPTRMVTVDPRAYALHKLWLSKRMDRDALKRTRDFQQAKAVADIAVHSMGLSFEDATLSALPAALKDQMFSDI